MKSYGDTEECSIVDCCILGQQYMVACDQNNSSVKLLDLESLSGVDVRPVRTAPKPVTKINDKEIALVRGQGYKSIIHFLTLKQSRKLVFQKNRVIHTRMFCTDIVFYQNSLIVSLHENENNGKYKNSL